MPYTSGLMTASDGVPVATYTWTPADRPRAVVQIAHGAAEHALRYDRFARHLTAHGYAVVASDHRGHGATAQATGGYGVAEGKPDAWRAIVDDLRGVGDQVRALHPGVPVVLFGHSLGSMLARDYAQEHADGLSGLVLCGTFRSLPGAEVGGALAHLEREVAEHGPAAPSSFVPRLFASFNDPYPHRTGFEWLSRDEAEVDAYVADERCGFPFSAGLSLAWTRAVRKVNDPRHLADIPADLPVHVVAGTEDPCNQRMTLVYELLEDLRYAGVRDLTWKGYEGARHEILNETNRDEVHEDLTAWLDARVG
ncbi:alpha/beta fold hydrolase [Streptomyces sp. G45]|uniref:alpha/beta fold hydrolase n=1 Tax=Streptomyces sp. G45 TaxID=3406627 RepID=UPI003C1C642A